MHPGVAPMGKLIDNLTAFARALRRAGVPLDSARVALAAQAMLEIDLAQREDVCSALEAVMISREQDRLLLRELFDAWFRDPGLTGPLPAPMVPGAEAKAEPGTLRPRVREALAPHQAAGRQNPPEQQPPEIERDAAMTASDRARLRHADFNALSGSEYRLVEQLARDTRLELPVFAARRLRPGARGARLHWPGVMRHAARTGGEMVRLPRLRRRDRPLPLLVLVDVSGSMERYARLLLAFLHGATRALQQRDFFTFGTTLTDITSAMRHGDSDAMLEAASLLISDFAGGTQLGASLATLRRRHAHRLVGRRTLVLLITDGLDTGAPQDLAYELDWLRRHCHRLLWLNPLLRFDAYAPLARGAALLHARAHGMLAVHNLNKLDELASGIATLLRRQHPLHWATAPRS